MFSDPGCSLPQLSWLLREIWGNVLWGYSRDHCSRCRFLWLKCWLVDRSYRYTIHFGTYLSSPSSAFNRFITVCAPASDLFPVNVWIFVFASAESVAVSSHFFYLPHFLLRKFISPQCSCGFSVVYILWISIFGFMYLALLSLTNFNSIHSTFCRLKDRRCQLPENSVLILSIWIAILAVFDLFAILYFISL